MKNKKQGQTVIEYILVVLMIAGVAGAIYAALKRYLPGPLNNIKASLEGNRDPYAQENEAGSGQKPAKSYYDNVEFKTK